MRPFSSGLAAVPSIKVLTSAVPSNAKVLTKADNTRKSIRPRTDRLSGGSAAAKPTEPPNTSGLLATNHETSATASEPRANSTRDGRCCSTGIPEKVNRAASTVRSPVIAANSSTGTSARAVAEKLPTTPPLATSPERRETVSDSPCSTPSTLRLVTACGPPPQLKVPAFNDSVASVPARLPFERRSSDMAPEPSKVAGTPNARPRRRAS